MKTISEADGRILRVYQSTTSGDVVYSCIEQHIRSPGGQWEVKELRLNRVEWQALRDFFEA